MKNKYEIEIKQLKRQINFLKEFHVQTIHHLENRRREDLECYLRNKKKFTQSVKKISELFDYHSPIDHMLFDLIVEKACDEVIKLRKITGLRLNK